MIKPSACIWPSLQLLLLITGLAALPPAYSDEAPKIAPALQPFVDGHSLAGAVVLVADTNKVLALEAVGWRDIAAQKPMQTNSLFWIASMTKSLTATLVMMLVDEGKVCVDDPVEKYLPEFRNVQLEVKRDAERSPPEKAAPGIQGFMINDERKGNGPVLLRKPAHPITVSNLLTHTSGLSPAKPPRQQKDKDFVPLREAVESYAETPLQFEPGSKYAYSNHGIDTLGRVIEVASGMRYEEFLQRRLLDPLGMKDTTFWPSEEQIRRLAKTYSPDARTNGLTEEPIGFFTQPLSSRKRQPWPAGGLFSTASDISVFCRMLLGGGVYEGRRYLSLHALQQMASTQTGDMLNKGQNEDGYGFGWQTARKLRATDRGLPGPFGHGGAHGTEMWIDPFRPCVTVFMVQLIGQPPETDKKMRFAFRQAVNGAFPKNRPADAPLQPAKSIADPHLEIGAPAADAKANAVPTVQPVSKENVVIFNEPGRYGGWPANHGLWQWGDELVAGFEVAWFKHPVNDHAVDRSKPFENWQARSLDGGKTWKMENELPFTPLGHEKPPAPLTAPLDFTAPDFALMFRFGGLHEGPSWFYTSNDRCRNWSGPYSFAVEGIDKICTRTDLIVLGPRDCLMFGSAAKVSDSKEGRVFCARTTDGGLHWKLVAVIGPEPASGYAIMPSTVRLPSGALVTAIRNGGAKRNCIDAWRSDDSGGHWTPLGDATPDIGSNPPALVLLKDGRLCLSYGYRRKPFGARARISGDEGRTWGPEIILRDDGLTGDLGYPRSLVRPDGKVLTVYYFNGPRDEDRTIQGTFWTPPALAPRESLLLGPISIRQ